MNIIYNGKPTGIEADYTFHYSEDGGKALAIKRTKDIDTCDFCSNGMFGEYFFNYQPDCCWMSRDVRSGEFLKSIIVSSSAISKVVGDNNKGTDKHKIALNLNNKLEIIY